MNTTLFLLVELKDNEIIAPLTILKVKRYEADLEASVCVRVCVFSEGEGESSFLYRSVW